MSPIDDGGSASAVAPADRGHRRRRDLPLSAAGAHPVPDVPWATVLRRRVRDRIEEGDRYRWWVLAVALGGMFSTGFSITILAVAVPDIADELDASIAATSWVVTAPILVFGLVGPTLGRAGDVFGHRRLFLGGLALAAVFAGLTALSPNVETLILFRVLAAAAGASTGPAAMAIINRVFPAGQRVVAMGYWSLVGAGGPVLGVIAGGPVVDSYSWRWIFVFQMPLTLGAVAVAALVLPTTSRRRDVSLDVVGASLLAGATLGLLLGVNRGAAWGWTHPLTLTSLALVGPLLAAFATVERRTASPLIPLRYFRTRNVVMPLVTQLWIQFAYMGGFILTPLLLQYVYGYGATGAGLLSIPRPLTFAIVGPLVGLVATRVGERVTAVSGSILVAISMVLLALGAAPGRLGLVVAALALSGAGLGAVSPSLASVVADSVDEDDYGVAGATQLMTGQIGVVIGIQVMQAVQLATEPACGPDACAGSALGELAVSYRWGYLVGGVAAIVAVVAATGVRRVHLDP